MIIKPYIKQFEQFGFGMFVHFGLYSIAERGEWTMKLHSISKDTYEQLMDSFNPDQDWAEKLVHAAREAGCRYITLTTRHHDGFSLYNTHGLNEYDAMHACHRDLIREFTDACNAEGIHPFFYHTLLDWHEPSYTSDFSSYLQYLRKSIQLLCTNYGPIGGIWLDGMWDKPDADWEEDRLYQMIRQYQPEAMIINNTGLSKRGELGNIELDSVTFERGVPKPINLKDSPKYIGSEMCETLNDHWGYALNDLNYKSAGQLISELAECRRSRSNFLLNTGLMGNGQMRFIDKAVFELIGQWTKINNEALHAPSPAPVIIQNKEKDFLLQNNNTYYLFCFDLPMQADPNVEEQQQSQYEDRFMLKDKIQSVTWLDNGQPLSFEQNNENVCIYTQPFPYGSQLVVRIVKILTMPSIAT